MSVNPISPITRDSVPENPTPCDTGKPVEIQRTLEVKVSSVALRSLNEGASESPPKSILAHRWQQLKSLFASLFKRISALFSERLDIKNKDLSESESHRGSTIYQGASTLISDRSLDASRTDETRANPPQGNEVLNKSLQEETPQPSQVHDFRPPDSDLKQEMSDLNPDTGDPDVIIEDCDFSDDESGIHEASDNESGIHQASDDQTHEDNKGRPTTSRSPSRSKFVEGDLHPTYAPPPGITKPSGIPNIGNACYRIASNQALLRCHPFLEILKKELEIEEIDRWQNETSEHFSERQKKAGEEFEVRKAIRTALIHLFSCLVNKKSSYEIEEAERALQFTLFTSKLASSFSMKDAFAQLDADEYLLLILSTVLRYQHIQQAVNRVNNETGVYERALAAEPLYGVVQVPILEVTTKRGVAISALESALTTKSQVIELDESTLEELGGYLEKSREDLINSSPNDVIKAIQIKAKRSLQEVVNALYFETTVNDSWKYDDSHSFTTYQKHVQLISDPKEMLVLQLKRGVLNKVQGVGPAINTSRLIMPPDGILDFSAAYKNVNKPLTYTIQSFIRLHADCGDFGHYTAYARENGKWYRFNDSIVNEVSEEVAQHEMTKAYILFLQKNEPPTAGE